MTIPQPLLGFAYRSQPLFVLSVFSLGGALALTCLFLILYALARSYDLAVRNLPHGRLREEAEAGRTTSKLLLRLVNGDGETRFRREIRLLRFFLACAGLATAVFVPAFHGLLTPAGTPALRGLLWALYILAYLILFFCLGDQLPSCLAEGLTVGFARFAFFLFRPLLFTVRPLERLTHALCAPIARALHEEAKAPPPSSVEDEVIQFLDTRAGAVEMEAHERAFIENVFSFNDKTAGDVMTHRTEMASLPLDATFYETMELVNSEKYTRFPVYKETIDDIVGVLHVKDLLYLAEAPELRASFALSKFIRHVLFTPESRIVRDLFIEMQKERYQMAIVIDEYGGTAGVVTLEDLIEELVGDIEDEYDDDELDIIPLGDNGWLVNGTCEIDVLADALHMPVPDDEYDTVAGFVIELLDRIPEPDEQPVVEYEGFIIRVLAVADNRIERLQISRVEKA